VLTYVSYILFFTTIFAAAGVFFYERYLDTRLESAKNKLIEEEGKFDQSQITSIKRFDEQIKLATYRMNEHLSILPIFTELERTIAQSLILNSFSYAREVDAAPKIEMNGEAALVGNLLFQRDIFTQSSLLEGALFSDVSFSSAAEKDEATGSVDSKNLDTTIAFSLAKTLPKQLLFYTASIPSSQLDTASDASAQEEERDVSEEITENLSSEGETI
jgi:hypothetical protein